MTRSSATNVKVVLISTLLVLGLTVNPARADHYDNSIAPLATFVFLSSLFRHKHRHHDGYHRHNHGHNYGHKRRSQSQSYGGYSHKAKRSYSRRDHRG